MHTTPLPSKGIYIRNKISRVVWHQSKCICPEGLTALCGARFIVLVIQSPSKASISSILWLAGGAPCNLVAQGEEKVFFAPGINRGGF